MRFRWGICTLLLFCTVRSIAIDAVVSHTVFYKEQAGRLVASIDAYWQVNPNTLHYVTTPEKKLAGSIRTDIVFLQNGEKIKEDHYIMQTVPRSNLSELAQHPVIELKRYELPTGMIKMRLLLTDMTDSSNRFLYIDSFMTTPADSKAFYSEVQLLDTIYTTSVQTPFTKNGKQQIPVCTNFIDDGVNTLRYYVELYNGNTINKDDLPLIQRVAISKNEHEGFYSDLEHRDTFNTTQPFSYTSGSFPIASLPSGNYYVRVSLENSHHEYISSRTYFFQRMNKHPYVDTAKLKMSAAADTGIENVTVLNLKKTFIAKYSSDQIRAILKMLLPFSDRQGVQTINGFLKKPDEMYMRYYIYNYFAAINKDDPGKAWKEFSQKITEVNKLYNTHSTPGYETDRGRMYLRYGAPTEVITVENEQGTLPYEIWQYNVLTQLNHKDIPNAIFLFYKQDNMISDYRLLHSTVAGELQNNQWRTVLYSMTNGGADYSNNRVEQVLGNK